MLTLVKNAHVYSRLLFTKKKSTRKGGGGGGGLGPLSGYAPEEYQLCKSILYVASEVSYNVSLTGDVLY